MLAAASIKKDILSAMGTSQRLTSTSVVESAIIHAPVDNIWPLLRLNQFEKFFRNIIKTEVLPPVGRDPREIIRWTFDEGYSLDVREEEYSNVKYYVSFNILKCDPWGLPYTSVLSVIRLFPITSGSSEGDTFAQWAGHYSSDATADVVLDGRVKRREALADLAKAVESPKPNS